MTQATEQRILMYTVGEQDDHDEVFPLFEGPEQGHWQAPTALEQRLYELSRTGEKYAYLRALATEGLYHPVPLTEGERPAAERGPVTHEAGDGTVVAHVYTAGVLPRPHPYIVYEFVTLGALADLCPAEVDVLVVNGATPCGELFLTDDGERQVWRELHAELWDPESLNDRLLTCRTGAPPPGPLLHGLACGAHLCYGNGDPWNTLDWHGAGYSSEVERLAEFWDVRARGEWLDVQERLLTCQVSPWHWDFTLGARTALAHENGPRVDPGMWRDCVEATLRQRVAPEAHGPELEAFAAELRGLVGTILRYESRFRADGLLAPDATVRSVAAWDLGRASKMARWGRGARYATQAEMYAALERASAATRATYGSWEEFSAAYVLGRCLHFDDERFGDCYTSVLAAHEVLATAPESPWRTVPFALAG